MKLYLIALAPALLLLLAWGQPARHAAPPALAVDRSPSDLALAPDGAFALTANTTADTVSLVDLKSGRVVVETGVGHGPFGIALARDGKTGVVTNRLADSITLLTVSPSGLKAEATIAVGDEPRGVALAPDGKTAFVALSGENALAFVDLANRRVEQRLPVGTEPWHVGVSPDGKRLAVSGARSQDVSVIDPVTRKILAVVKLRGHNARHVAMSPDNNWAYVPSIAERGRPATKENIDLGWIVATASAVFPCRKKGRVRRFPSIRAAKRSAMWTALRSARTADPGPDVWRNA